MSSLVFSRFLSIVPAEVMFRPAGLAETSMKVNDHTSFNNFIFPSFSLLDCREFI